MVSIILSRASGIRFNDYCNGCSVNRCNINLNASEGIYARNLEGLLIEDSNMIGNNLNGIHLENVVDGFVDDNNTWRNGLHGVFVQGSFGIDVEDNHARDNQLSGFVALNSDVDLEANLSFRNFLDGFLIDSCPGITLSGNSSLFNDQGFAWRNSDFNLILGNESARNDKNGFLFVNGEFNIVTLGYAQRNGQNGHLLESETSLNFLSDSVTIRNTDDGILDLGTGNFLSDNISVGE